LKLKKETTNTEELNQLVVGLIQDKKGKDIVSLDLRAIPEAVTDYFIVCHGDSTTQVRAIVDHIEEECIKQGLRKSITVEGRSNGEWALVDLGDVVVHVFLNEKREFYQLEDLWSDAKVTAFENV
jgi:ribosome-associated protein